MTILTGHQVVGYWIQAGGPSKSAAMWASISFSESSWDTVVASYTDAVGLYQLEPYSWPAGAGPYSEVRNPYNNSLAAVILSGGGVNFAPWDTAYANIGRSGRYSFLSWPESGSAAMVNLAAVLGQLGSTAYGGYTAPAEPGLTDTLPAALQFYQEATTAVLPRLTRQAVRLRQVARGLY